MEAGRPFKRKRLWHSSRCELMEDFGLHHRASSLGAFRTHSWIYFEGKRPQESLADGLWGTREVEESQVVEWSCHILK